MQSTHLIIPLFISTAITAFAMATILRSWWKRRLTPTLLYSIAVILFSGMALDLLLDQVYIPFRSWFIEINGHVLWWSNVLLAFFIVGGFLFWYFAIMYSEYDTPPTRAIIVSFIAGGALLGEIVKGDWSEQIPLIIEALAFIILSVEVIHYGRKVIRTTEEKQEKIWIFMYFLGFLLWIIAGQIGIVLGNLPSFEFIADFWTIPYSMGLLVIAITVARNPRLLFISEARALDLLVLDKSGTLILGHRISRHEDAIDIELMGSAMSGVISLMKEMLAGEGDLQRVDHGDIKILVERGLYSTFLLVVTKETARFRQSLRNIVLEFEANYRSELLEDSGMVTQYKNFQGRIDEIFE